MPVFQRLQDSGSNKKFFCFHDKTYAECSCGWKFHSWFPGRVAYRATVHAAIQHANEVALVTLEIKKPSVMLKNTSAASLNTSVKELTPTEVKEAKDTKAVVKSPRTITPPTSLPDGLLPLPTKLPDVSEKSSWGWAGKNPRKKS